MYELNVVYQVSLCLTVRCYKVTPSYLIGSSERQMEVSLNISEVYGVHVVSQGGLRVDAVTYL